MASETSVTVDDTVADTETSPASGAARRKKARPAPASRPVQVVVVALSVLGGLSLWFLLYATVLSGIQEHSDQGRLYDTFRARLAQETSPIGAPIDHGQPVALIDAPGAGISNLVVLEGTTSDVLRSGPGHLSDSPLPGQVGNSYIYGRSVMFGAPFANITDLKAGNTLRVTTGQGVFAYRVDDVRHAGDRLPRPLAPSASRITLVSSASEGWRSGWAPDQVVYMDATLAHGSASGLPAPIPSSVSLSSAAMQGDPKAIVALIFWLEGLAVVVVGFLWSWARWTRLQTWMVGLPVVLGMLWGTTGALSALIPNLI
jgi:sortase A